MTGNVRARIRVQAAQTMMNDIALTPHLRKIPRCRSCIGDDRRRTLRDLRRRSRTTGQAVRATTRSACREHSRISTGRVFTGFGHPARDGARADHDKEGVHHERR